ncbi:MAG: hypothetical protein V2A56_10110 [bacterium]
MNSERVSFNISAEDRVRLQALAEKMRISESEALEYLFNREFQSWEEDVITNQDDVDEGT